jgi:hypothetical protein
VNRDDLSRKRSAHLVEKGLVERDESSITVRLRKILEAVQALLQTDELGFVRFRQYSR